jgi:hypothetical protein
MSIFSKTMLILAAASATSVALSDKSFAIGADHDWTYLPEEIPVNGNFRVEDLPKSRTSGNVVLTIKMNIDSDSAGKWTYSFLQDPPKKQQKDDPRYVSCETEYRLSAPIAKVSEMVSNRKLKLPRVKVHYESVFLTGRTIGGKMLMDEQFHIQLSDGWVKSKSPFKREFETQMEMRYQAKIDKEKDYGDPKLELETATFDIKCSAKINENEKQDFTNGFKEFGAAELTVATLKRAHIH